MKLLLVDLDNISGLLSAPKVGEKRYQSLLAGVLDRALAARVPGSRVPVRLGRLEKKHGVVAVLAMNTATLTGLARFGEEWSSSVVLLTTEIARVIFGHSADVEVEIVLTLSAPETVDAALVEMLQFSPWEQGEKFQKIAVATQDGLLRREIEKHLPADANSVQVDAGFQVWTTASCLCRTGTGAPPTSTQGEVPVAWSAVLPVGLNAANSQSIEVLNALDLKRPAGLAAQIDAEPHLLTQISMSKFGVAGVARLARMLSGQLTYQFQWLGVRDYLEVRTTENAELDTAVGQLLPIEVSPLGPGALRFVGAGFTAASRVPVQIWRAVLAADPAIPVLASGKAPRGLLANDMGLLKSRVAAEAALSPIVLQCQSRPQVGADGKKRKVIVFYAPVGWWWLCGNRAQAYLRTRLPVAWGPQLVGAEMLALPTVIRGDLRFHCAEMPNEITYSCTTDLAAGALGFAKGADRPGGPIAKFAILAAQSCAKGQNVRLRSAGQLSEREWQQYFPLEWRIYKELARAPVALATPMPLSDSPGLSVLH